jgi:transposase-like protein
MNSERRHLNPQEKIAALKRHLLEGVPVSTICDELGIAPTLFYRWQKELFENGHTLFENGRHAKAVEDAKDEKIQKLEAKLTRKNEVMAELMEAHTQLKKDLVLPGFLWVKRYDKMRTHGGIQVCATSISLPSF